MKATGRQYNDDLIRPLSKKIADSIARVQHFEQAALERHPDGFYEAFSGGKDSIAMDWIMQLAGVKFSRHYHLTTVDPPDVVRFIRKHYSDTAFERPKMTMWQLIEHKMMPPTRLARYCCEHLKEGGGDGRVVVLGLRWAESRNRAKRPMVEACIRGRRKNTTLLSPIIDWTEADVWEFIRREDLAYPALYDEGFTRLGCIGCPCAGKAGQARHFERWPKYKAAYIRAFQRAVERRRTRPEYLGEHAKWTSGQAMFDWWVEVPGEMSEPCPLFEGEAAREEVLG